jgi:hypothetical protein
VERCPLQLLCKLHLGFTGWTESTSERGEKLADLLDTEPNVTASGVVNLRWTFPDGSAVVRGQST